MRKAWVIVVAAVFFVFVLESGSSYVIYRHFATLHRAYSPAGSASAALLGFILKGGGRHDDVALSIDHAPLFHADPTLGYAMFPGRYQITEQMGGQSHRFTITVDDADHRVASDHSNRAAGRIFVTGDSAMFGWGLNDEQTAPWLLQSRFPTWDVVNLSLTSYSTIHGIFQLEAARPPVGAEDIVVLAYHQITNGFNVASAEMLGYLQNGFEQQLGDAELVRNMQVPFGTLANGRLVLGRYPVWCGTKAAAKSTCARVAVSPAEAMQVSMKAYDAIMAAHKAHFVVAFLGGEDRDPVIEHLRNSGAVIADLRTVPSDPDANDEVSFVAHAGPFWHLMLAERLAAALVRAGLVR